MTKKRLLIVSGVISLTVSIINYIGVYKICLNIFECTEILFGVMMILFPVVSLFIFSLITFKMHEEVFRSWWRFSRIWIPLSMIAIFVSPSNTSNWMFPVEKGSVAFFLSVIFVIVSACIIVYRHYKLEKK